MKRREGIVKRWQEDNAKELKPSQCGEIWQSEYANYTDLCYFCYEEPLPYNDWLNQTINPAKQ